MRSNILKLKVQECGDSAVGEEEEFLSECDRFSDNDERQEETGSDHPMKRLVKEFRIQLTAERNILRRAKKEKYKKEIYPLDSEIQAVLTALEQKFPDKDVFGIAKGLYEQLIPQNLLKCKRMIANPNESEDQIKERLYLSNPISRVERNIKVIESLKNYVGFKKVFLKSVWRPASFPNSYKEMRYRIKTITAKSFVVCGYSFHYFREQFKDQEWNNIFKSRFYISLMQIVTEAYKFLQQFLLEDCQIKIQKNPREVFKQLFFRLYHCHKSFKNEDCTTFIAIIKALYGLDDVTLDEYGMVRLYLITQKGLRMIMLKKLSDQSHRPIPDSSECIKEILYEITVNNRHNLEPHNIWTFELERELISVYKRIQYIPDIKKHFRKKYPELTKFLQGPGVKYRIHQIIRITLRRVKIIVQSNKDIAIQFIPQLNDDIVAYFKTSPRCLRARLLLVDLYQIKETAYTPKVEECVREINQAFAERYRYNWFQMIARDFDKKLRNTNNNCSKMASERSGDRSDDILSTTSSVSIGSKFYAPTRAKDLADIVLFPRRDAYLTHVYFNEEKNYNANYNKQSQKDVLSEIGSEPSAIFKLEKVNENQDYDSYLYHGEE